MKYGKGIPSGVHVLISKEKQKQDFRPKLVRKDKDDITILNIRTPNMVCHTKPVRKHKRQSRQKCIAVSPRIEAVREILVTHPSILDK